MIAVQHDTADSKAGCTAAFSIQSRVNSMQSEKTSGNSQNTCVREPTSCQHKAQLPTKVKRHVEQVKGIMTHEEDGRTQQAQQKSQHIVDSL